MYLLQKGFEMNKKLLKLIIKEMIVEKLLEEGLFDTIKKKAGRAVAGAALLTGLAGAGAGVHKLDQDRTSMINAISGMQELVTLAQAIEFTQGVDERTHQLDQAIKKLSDQRVQEDKIILYETLQRINSQITRLNSYYPNLIRNQQAFLEKYQSVMNQS